MKPETLSTWVLQAALHCCPTVISLHDTSRRLVRCRHYVSRGGVIKLHVRVEILLLLLLWSATACTGYTPGLLLVLRGRLMMMLMLLLCLLVHQRIVVVDSLTMIRHHLHLVVVMPRPLHTPAGGSGCPRAATTDSSTWCCLLKMGVHHDVGVQVDI